MYLPTLKILTELIRCKYNLTYNETVHIFLHRKYQYYLSENNLNYDKHHLAVVTTLYAL